MLSLTLSASPPPLSTSPRQPHSPRHSPASRPHAPAAGAATDACSLSTAAQSCGGLHNGGGQGPARAPVPLVHPRLALPTASHSTAPTSAIHNHHPWPPESTIAADMLKAMGLARDGVATGNKLVAWLRERRSLDEEAATAFGQRMVELGMLVPESAAHRVFRGDKGAAYRIVVPVSGAGSGGSGGGGSGGAGAAGRY